MFWRKKSNIDADDETWQLACWAWLDQHCGSVTRPEHPGLVLPDAKTFPRTNAKGTALAQHYLTNLQHIYGMADWPVTLVEQAPSREPPKSIAFAELSSRSALGTYSRHGNAARITYDPALLNKPLQLVATLAHELAHYRLEAIAVPPPGGWDMVEFATDLTVAHAGLGLFGANAARTFETFTDFDRQGWSSQRAGYLTENEWTFALALFTHQRAISPAGLKPHLKDYLFSGYRKNRAYVDANANLLLQFDGSAS
jgi:hypothetical protein